MEVPGLCIILVTLPIWSIPPATISGDCAKTRSVLNPYLGPADKLTIGYGHTGNDVKTLGAITKEKAEALLLADCVKYEKAVNEMVLVPQEQHQFDALVSFTYNLGRNPVGDRRDCDANPQRENACADVLLRGAGSEQAGHAAGHEH